MRHQTRLVGSFLLTAAAVLTPAVSAQTRSHGQQSVTPCAPSRTHTGGAYLVIPGGAAEKILQLKPAPAPAPAKATHGTRHTHGATHSTKPAPGCQPRTVHTR